MGIKNTEQPLLGWVSHTPAIAVYRMCDESHLYSNSIIHRNVPFRPCPLSRSIQAYATMKVTMNIMIFLINQLRKQNWNKFYYESILTEPSFPLALIWGTLHTSICRSDRYTMRIMYIREILFVTYIVENDIHDSAILLLHNALYNARYTRLYNARLTEWMEGWNHHKLRTAGSRTPLQLCMSQFHPTDDQAQIWLVL